jgi:hypothetical protein
VCGFCSFFCSSFSSSISSLDTNGSEFDAGPFICWEMENEDASSFHLHLFSLSLFFCFATVMSCHARPLLLSLLQDSGLLEKRGGKGELRGSDSVSHSTVEHSPPSPSPSPCTVKFLLLFLSSFWLLGRVREGGRNGRDVLLTVPTYLLDTTGRAR